MIGRRHNRPGTELNSHRRWRQVKHFTQDRVQHMRFLSANAYRAMPGILIALLVCQSTSGNDLAQAVQAAVRKVEPSIVRLRIIGGEQVIDGDAVTSLVTTGIVISENGEILTSQFAMEGNPEAVLVEDQSGKRTNATVIATDSVRRIVLLKANEGHWTPVVPDNSQSVEVGQWSIALGRFYAAASSSISVGIISAMNRIHGMAIQTDAKVSPVNYGGPLVMLNGTVSGILVPLSPRGGGTSASGIEWYDSGIGFAIPLKDALKSAEKLRSGKNLVPGKIGVQLVSAGAYDSDVVIDRVLPGGPSERAGLLKGDRILAVDGTPLERSSVLMESIAGRYAGDSITLKVQRGEEQMTADVDLVEKISPVPQGYLGLLPIRPAKLNKPSESVEDAIEQNPENHKDDEDDEQDRQLDIPQIKLPENLRKGADGNKHENDSVPLIVVHDSPAAQVIPTGIELLSANGIATASLAELAEAIGEVTPGSSTKIDYRVPGATETQMAEVTAGTRPEVVTELSDDLLEQIRTFHSSMAVNFQKNAVTEPNTNPSLESETILTEGVSRREFHFAERGQCVVLSPTETGTVMLGVVILLSAHDKSEEEIMRTWKSVLKSHSVILVIPKNPEAEKLTEVDIPLVMTSLRAAVLQAGADIRRVVAVANRAQSPLAWRCAFGGPSGIRGIALTEGWISDSEIQGVEGAGYSVLLLDQTQSTQANALRDLSSKSLTEAGFWAPRPPLSALTEASEEHTARCIADWSFLMRSF
jgi:S1-C subfamily serine protease